MNRRGATLSNSGLPLAQQSNRERQSPQTVAGCDERSRLRIAAVSGVLGVVGNIGAVALLWNTPAAYKLAKLSVWAQKTFADPSIAATSSVTFAVGLIAMAAWAHYFGHWAGGALARTGGTLIAVVSLFNAAGTLAPLVVAYHVGDCGAACDAAARGLLGTSLALDAFFNLGLGVGLLLVAAGAQLPSAMRLVITVAGLLTLPVAAQAVWSPAAHWLVVAAPLWLLVMVSTSVRWFRDATICN